MTYIAKEILIHAAVLALVAVVGLVGMVIEVFGRKEGQ